MLRILSLPLLAVRSIANLFRSVREIPYKQAFIIFCEHHYIGRL